MRYDLEELRSKVKGVVFVTINRLVSEFSSFRKVPDSMLRWVYLSEQGVTYRATPDEFMYLTDFLRKKIIDINRYADVTVLVFGYDVYKTKYKLTLATCQDYEIIEKVSLDIIKVGGN